jgi:hypothetical protein
MGKWQHTIFGGLKWGLGLAIAGVWGGFCWDVLKSALGFGRDPLPAWLLIPTCCLTLIGVAGSLLLYLKTKRDAPVEAEIAVRDANRLHTSQILLRTTIEAATNLLRRHQPGAPFGDLVQQVLRSELTAMSHGPSGAAGLLVVRASNAAGVADGDLDVGAVPAKWAAWHQTSRRGVSEQYRHPFSIGPSRFLLVVAGLRPVDEVDEEQVAGMAAQITLLSLAWHKKNDAPTSTSGTSGPKTKRRK